MALAGYAEIPGVQAKCAAWRRRQELGDRVPESLTEVLGHVAAFADPALTGEAADAIWQPDELAWRTDGTHA